MENLEARIHALEVRQALTEQRIDTVGTDVKEIKDTLKWLNRLILGAMILNIVGLVIVGKV